MVFYGEEVGVAEFATAFDNVGLVGEVKGGKNLVEVAHIVLPARTEGSVVIVAMHHVDGAAEEACHIGGPDEFFLAFALVVDGEG